MKPDFAGWRLSLGILQVEAAALFRSSVRAWKYWENGRRAPGTATVLLEVLQAYPLVAAELLHKLRNGEQK
jgi:DNA-binding transcriptional regulator YiaG